MTVLSRAARYFDEVARAGSVRKAARTLHVAASAVNRHILELEEEFGVQLFERTTQGLRLSPAGELLVHRVRTWKNDYERAKILVDDLRKLRRGTIRVAAVEGLVSHFLPTVIQRFRRDYEGITFQVTTGSSQEVLQHVEAGEHDVGITFNPPPHRSLKREASVLCRMGVVVNPQHPLSSKTEIRLHELQDYLVAIPSPEISLRELIDTAQEIAAVTLPQTLVTNSIEMMKAFARLSGGAALLTDIDALREIAAGELVHVPLGGRVTMPQLLVALTRTGRHPSAAAAAFVEQLQGAFDVAHR